MKSKLFALIHWQETSKPANAGTIPVPLPFVPRSEAVKVLNWLVRYLNRSLPHITHTLEVVDSESSVLCLRPAFRSRIGDLELVAGEEVCSDGWDFSESAKKD